MQGLYWLSSYIHSFSMGRIKQSRLIPMYHARFIHYDDVIMSAIASQITSLTIVYSIVYSDADQRKHQSSASLAFVQGIHRGPVNSPHKWPVTRKMLSFDDVIMSVATVALFPYYMGRERRWPRWIKKALHIGIKRMWYLEPVDGISHHQEKAWWYFIFTMISQLHRNKLAMCVFHHRFCRVYYKFTISSKSDKTIKLYDHSLRVRLTMFQH